MSLPGLGGDTSLRVLSLLATAGGLALITRAVARLAGRATGVLAGPGAGRAARWCSSRPWRRAATGWPCWPPAAPSWAWSAGCRSRRAGCVLFGLAGAGMGLAHWYAVTVLAAFVVAALLLRGRRAVPVVLIGAAAALPTVVLVGLNLLNGTGGRNAEHLHDTGGRLAGLAVEAWAGGRSRCCT